MNINEKTRKALLRFQQNEITESLLYTQLAAIEKDPSNKEVLLQIANDEKGHYTILKKYTGQEISPNKLRVTKYYWLARILGITFAIKLMEDSEESAKNDYASYDEYLHYPWLPPNIYLPSPRMEMKTGNILLRHRSIRE